MKFILIAAIASFSLAAVANSISTSLEQERLENKKEAVKANSKYQKDELDRQAEEFHDHTEAEKKQLEDSSKQQVKDIESEEEVME